MFSISTIGMLAFSHSLTSGLNKSTLNQCINNNDNSACNYLIENGNNFQKQQATKALLVRGL